MYGVKRNYRNGFLGKYKTSSCFAGNSERFYRICIIERVQLELGDKSVNRCENEIF